MLPLPLPQRGGSLEQLCLVPQSSEARTISSCGRLALGGAAAGRPLSAAGHFRRTGLGQDRAVEDAAGAGRPQRRPGPGPFRAKSANCSSPPTTAMCWHSTISPPCRPGCPTRFAGWRAAAASRCASSTPMRTRCCSMPRARSFSTASRTSSRRPDLADRAHLSDLGAHRGAQRRRSESELWREFELARPRILGALLDAAAHGLRDTARRSPRSAAADGRLRALGRRLRNGASGLLAPSRAPMRQPQGRDRGYCRRRPGRRLRAGDHGRAQLVDRDRRRSFAGRRRSWQSRENSIGWPKNPRALAGRLRRAQTFLRALGIKSRSVVKAAPEAGSSGSTPRWKTPTAPGSQRWIIVLVRTTATGTGRRHLQ